VIDGLTHNAIAAARRYQPSPAKKSPQYRDAGIVRRVPDLTRSVCIKLNKHVSL
jgi:hypothetical protein